MLIDHTHNNIANHLPPFSWSKNPYDIDIPGLAYCFETSFYGGGDGIFQVKDGHIGPYSGDRIANSTPTYRNKNCDLAWMFSNDAEKPAGDGELDHVVDLGGDWNVSSDSDFFEMDGNNDYCVIDKPIVTEGGSAGTDSWSFEIFLYMPSTAHGNYHTIFHHRTNETTNGNSWLHDVGSGTTSILRFGMRDNSGNQIEVSSTGLNLRATTPEWAHIVCVKQYNSSTSSTLSLYGNGNLLDSVSGYMTQYVGVNDIYIGAREPSGGNYGEFYWQLIRLWNKALTSTEVGQLCEVYRASDATEGAFG